MKEATQPQAQTMGYFEGLRAIFGALASLLVTTCVQGNTFIRKALNTLIYGVSAAEHVAHAAEGRAEIYAKGVVDDGDIQRRETTLRHQRRLDALIEQEDLVKTAAKPAKAKAK